MIICNQCLALSARIQTLEAELAAIKAKPGVLMSARRKTFGGPKRQEERCPCGKNTLKRAQARRFACCKKEINP